jgi:phospholipase/lecithinase/hemolysin
MMSDSQQGGAASVVAQPPTALYSFGDSYSDAGNVWRSDLGTSPLSPPYSDGRWSNGNLWVQDLATAYGLPALEPSTAGGTDFAYGGAQTGNPSLPAPQYDLQQQLAAFDAQVPSPASGALYTVEIGINDVLKILDEPDPAQYDALAEASVETEVSFISSLIADGARDILVMNVPDLGTLPIEVALGPQRVASVSALSAFYDTALQSALATVQGAAIHVLDAYSLFDSVVADPGAFGLANATSAVWSGDSTDSTSGTLATTVPAQQNQYFFWDIVHPTAGGHSVIAAATEALLDAACFAAGTRILTGRGKVPVEHLSTDDLVRTQDGRLAPVRWLGHRRVDCARHPRPWDVCPMRVRRAAFGADIPCRDLLLSPDHALWFAGHLIPVRYLVNGATVTREPARPVTYWHVELDRHDILFAEALACESYLDTGNRAAFANGGAATRMHPDFARTVWRTAARAPLACDGDVVVSARRHLAAQARALADGEMLPPRIDGARHRFTLRRPARDLRLVSRSGVPAEFDGTDTRRLGVMLGHVAAFQPWRWRDIALAEITGEGWHGLETDGARTWRWTSGDAGLMPPADTLLLDLHVAAAQPSWLPPGSWMEPANRAGWGSG